MSGGSGALQPLGLRGLGDSPNPGKPRHTFHSGHLEFGEPKCDASAQRRYRSSQSCARGRGLKGLQCDKSHPRSVSCSKTGVPWEGVHTQLRQWLCGHHQVVRQRLGPWQVAVGDPAPHPAAWPRTGEAGGAEERAGRWPLSRPQGPLHGSSEGLAALSFLSCFVFGHKRLGSTSIGLHRRPHSQLSNISPPPNPRSVSPPSPPAQEPQAGDTSLAASLGIASRVPRLRCFPRCAAGGGCIISIGWGRCCWACVLLLLVHTGTVLLGLAGRSSGHWAPPGSGTSGSRGDCPCNRWRRAGLACPRELRMSGLPWAYWPFAHLLWRRVCSDPLLGFFIRLVVCLLLSCRSSLSILDTSPYQMHDL